MQMCPSWPKEHDWKSCKSLTRLLGFESPHLRHRRHGLHIVCDDFFIAYIKVISSLIPSFLLSPKSLRFPGTPILFTHGLHIVRDDFFIYTKLPLKIKKDTVTQVSNDVENVPQSYIRNELASPVSNDNVTQNKASVNNNDTKFSLDVDRFSND